LYWARLVPAVSISRLTLNRDRIAALQARLDVGPDNEGEPVAKRFVARFRIMAIQLQPILGP
jgi:hypothetical protein